MAIVTGLNVSIQVNGTSLHEYRDHDGQEIRPEWIQYQNASSLFLAPCSPSEFLYQRILSLASDALGVFLYLDATYVESVICEKGLHDYRLKKHVSESTEDGLDTRNPLFDDIKRPLLIAV